MTTTAKIAAKGTSGTGLTEELAKRCHDQLGRKVLAVVELVAETRSEKRNGDESVTLSILTLEPAPTTATEDHLRELARSFYYERQLAEGQQPTLDGDGIEPDLKTVLEQGHRFEPHPFLPVDAADDDGICDLCGEVQGRPQHAERTAMDDPFTVPATDEAGDDGPEEDDDLGDPEAEHEDVDEPSHDDADTWDDEAQPVAT